MKKKDIILIVDDFQSIRKVIGNTLERHDYEVLEAENGQDAINVIEKANGKIDLILSDYNMPVMNGFDFLVEIRKHPKYGKIPFVFLTSEKNLDKMKEAKTIGLDAWIQKPYTIDTFVSQIKYCIDKNRKNA
jgi:CheY-like chemotaxis protein